MAASAWLSLLQILFCENPKSFLRFGLLWTKSITTLTSESLFARLLLEFKVGSALNLLCVIVVCSLALILLVIENDLSGVAVVAPLTNVITMVTTFFIKSLSLVERALRFDKIINWAVFLSVQIVCEWSISSPKIARKLSNSWWYSFPLIDSSNNYSCLRID